VATIQNEDARKLLGIITSAVKSDRLLTYKSAAELLGRFPPENHSRAVAQMCDLLDAAAALAHVPLLALVAIRMNSGQINPKAWREYGESRKAIIEKSKRHSFTKADFKAISKALTELDGKGNRSAWKFVRKQIPHDDLLHYLAYAEADTDSDALDDMGTDAPDRAKTTGWVYARDPQIRKLVIKRAKGRCEYCGKLGFKKPDDKRYLESHHIIALANEGVDRMTNVIALCPNDHREAHFGERGAELEKAMIAKVMAIEGKAKP
jgi:HNH endonuclease